MRSTLFAMVALALCVDISHQTKASVCILIPVTSRKQQWTQMEHSFLYQMPLASLASTCEPRLYSYTVFVGYDVGDAFFDNTTTLNSLKQWTAINIPFASLELHPFINELKKPGPVTNFLSQKAHNHGCHFLYRINDDTELLTQWTTAFITTLLQFSPPLLGVVGPTCNQGNTAILTHDFVHRSHLDIFPTHYPAELTDWWQDDWMSAVYGVHNTRKLNEVVVIHHMQATRYEVNWESEKKLRPLVEQGIRTIAARLDCN